MALDIPQQQFFPLFWGGRLRIETGFALPGSR
jgi:hypothetical protein